MPREFPLDTKRYIAYFDIMGFKDFIYRNGHDVVAEKMNHVSNLINTLKEIEKEILVKDDDARMSDYEKGIFLPVMFSDSVVFVSRGSAKYDLKKIIMAASFFLYRMFKAGVPIKGAIGFGQFTADFDRSKFFGRPLVDTYLLAEETNFYGAVLHHDVEAKLTDADWKSMRDLLATKKVPMKAGKVTHCFVDWRRFLKEDINEILSKFYATVSGSTRAYVDHTIEVYKEPSGHENMSETPNANERRRIATVNALRAQKGPLKRTGLE